MSSSVVRSFGRFERVAALVLLILLATVVTYGIGFAVYRTAAQLFAMFTGAIPPLELDMLHDVFGKFLLILIGLELARTIVMYMDEHVVHVEIVFEVAMIAAARHAIDVSHETTPGQFLGTAAVIVALGVAYYLYKNAASSVSRGE
jgi:uncharacterized membrane protein (DUF373 family)